MVNYIVKNRQMKKIVKVKMNISGFCFHKSCKGISSSSLVLMASAVEGKGLKND